MNTILKFFSLMCLSILISCNSPERNTEENQTENGGRASAVKSADEELREETDYLVSAHINSQLQIALGKMADQRSQSQQLREFGQQLTQENLQIQSNISALADASGIQIQPALTPEYAALLDSVRNFSGRDFDYAFLALVIEEHDEDINRFSSLASKTSNPMVREILTDNLEILRRRKNQARDIKESFN